MRYTFVYIGWTNCAKKMPFKCLCPYGKFGGIARWVSMMRIPPSTLLKRWLIFWGPQTDINHAQLVCRCSDCVLYDRLFRGLLCLSCHAYCYILEHWCYWNGSLCVEVWAALRCDCKCDTVWLWKRTKSNQVAHTRGETILNAPRGINNGFGCKEQ